MTTVGSHLDAIQLKLHDDGSIWSRAELLDWFNDGLRVLLGQTGAVKVFTAMPIPPRHKYAYTHEWEAQYAEGSGRKFTYSSHAGAFECTNLWEAESQEATSSGPTNLNMTHLWELAHAGDEAETHFRFFLPHDNKKILDVWYDHKHLDAVTVRELDVFEDAWWRVEGEPYFWTHGLGRNKTFEVYEIETTYVDSHTKSGGPFGIIRRITGDRTYSSAGNSDELGVLRGIRSDDRQYWPRSGDVGLVRNITSSENAILVYHVVSPEALDEQDEVVGLPGPLEKRIRFYVLSVAFNRQGEGYNPNLALHYQQRFARSIQVFKRLSVVLNRDRQITREGRSMRRRDIPRPQLPSTFARAPWLR